MPSIELLNLAPQMKEIKNILVTGGNGEIGRAIIDILDENGYNIIAPSSQLLDCSSILSITDYFKNFPVKSFYGYIHCAGINNPKSIEEITEESFNQSLMINMTSIIFICKEINKKLENGGKVVFISSIYGSISRLGRLEYATSKHAIHGIVKSLALELASRNILVNSVSPGFIETSLTYKNNSPSLIDKIVNDIPLKRMGQPKEIAELINFLISNKNTFLTGQDIIIDGGYLSGGYQK